MTRHPHVHMVVLGGGIAPDGNHWIPSRAAFLLPVRLLGKLVRRLFLTRLLVLHEAVLLGVFGTLPLPMDCERVEARRALGRGFLLTNPNRSH